MRVIFFQIMLLRRYCPYGCTGFEDKIIDLLLDLEKKWQTSEANNNKKMNQFKGKGQARIEAAMLQLKLRAGWEERRGGEKE